MRPEVGRERQRGIGQRDWVEVVGQSTPDSRSEQSAWMSSVPVKEDRWRWVDIPSNFVENSLEIQLALVYIYTKGMQCYITPLLHFELTQTYFSFVRLFFFSHSLDCISCGREEMCDAPIGTASWSPAQKWNGSKKLMYAGCRGGIVTLGSLSSTYLRTYTTKHL